MQQCPRYSTLSSGVPPHSARPNGTERQPCLHFAKGLSGGKLAYRRYSEGRAAHWLILIAADRVDAAESHLRSLATLHPDNPITETGVMTEFHRHGIDSRIGKHRADVVHQTMDSVIVAGPWLS